MGSFEVAQLRIRDADEASRSQDGRRVQQFVLIADVEGAAIRSSVRVLFMLARAHLKEGN